MSATQSILPEAPALPNVEVKPGVLRIFKSRMSRLVYIFRDGSRGIFAPRTNETAGHYLTDDPKKIAELELESKSHPHIYVDQNESEVEARLADPSVAAREQIASQAKEEFTAMLKNPESLKAAGIDPAAMEKLLGGRDMGSTGPGTTPQLQGITSSANVGAASADSNGVAGGGIKVGGPFAK
jgi:hypothetical protein